MECYGIYAKGKEKMNMKKKRIAALVCAVLAVSVLSGCNSEGSGENGTSSDTTASSEQGGVTAISGVGDGLVEDIDTGTRPIAEGDDYAINKINNKSPEDSIPGGYKLQSYSEEQQGKLFANGKSKVEIRAYNYKEDLQDMAVWADQACAIIKIANITMACDTNFDTPENTTVLGFDAIKYNYEIIQYEFIEDENNPEGEKIKSPIGTYKGIAYYFYSDQDAYVIMFDTAEDNWDEQSAAFEEFLNDLEITKTEY